MNEKSVSKLEGMTLENSGKVRDTHNYVYNPNLDLRVVVTSNRVSIFDFPLNAEIPDKGEILTAMNIFWYLKLQDLCPHDVVCFGAKIDEALPLMLKGNPDLQKRAIVVEKLQMLGIESVVRGYLTGSALKAYLREETVGGVNLPSGLQDGSKLPVIIWDPTTKEQIGHDLPISPTEVRRMYGDWPGNFSLQAYQRAQEIVTDSGIIIADTKFELGCKKKASYPHSIMMADERLTPDSSRYWDVDDWHKALEEKRPPHSMDKQLIREWGKKIGIDKLDPKNPEHRKQVYDMEVPKDLIEALSKLYHKCFQRVTGSNLREFQVHKMGIEFVF